MTSMDGAGGGYDQQDIDAANVITSLENFRTTILDGIHDLAAAGGFANLSIPDAHGIIGYLKDLIESAGDALKEVEDNIPQEVEISSYETTVIDAQFQEYIR